MGGGEVVSAPRAHHTNQDQTGNYTDYIFLIKIAEKTLFSSRFTFFFFLLSLLIFAFCVRYLPKHGRKMNAIIINMRKIFICVFMLFSFLVHLHIRSNSIPRQHVKCKWKNMLFFLLLFLFGVNRNIFGRCTCSSSSENKRWKKWERNYHTNVAQWIKRKNENK